MRLVAFAPLLAAAILVGPALAAREEPDTPEQAADRVLAAKDPATLNVLAGREDPDPWLVADELCSRGEHRAALAFAGAVPRRTTESLPAYVRSRLGVAEDRAARETVTAASELVKEKKHQELLRRLEPCESRGTDVTSLRVAHLRAVALESLGRGADADRLQASVEKRARGIGWWRMAASAANELGAYAFARNDFRAAYGHFRRSLDACRGVEIPTLTAGARINLGVVNECLGRNREALDLLRKGLEEARAASNERWEENALSNLASLLERTGEYDRAMAYAVELRRLHRERRNVAGEARGLNMIGILHFRRGETDEALSCYERATVMAKKVGDRELEMSLLVNVANVHQSRGEWELALREYDEALTWAEGRKDHWFSAKILMNIGDLHRKLGRNMKALTYLERARDTFVRVGDPHGQACVGVILGGVWRELHDSEKAVEILLEAHRLAGRVQSPGILEKAALRLAVYLTELQRHEEARRFREEAVALHRRLGGGPLLALSAWILEAHGKRGEALPFRRQELERLETSGDLRGTVGARVNLGSLLGSLEQDEEALLQLDRALEEADRLGHQRWTQNALHHRARVLLHLGRDREAIESARAVYEMGIASCAGLAEEEGARARERLDQTLPIGAEAAMRLGDERALWFFLESGRAVMLLEALGDRTSVRDAAVPERLTRMESEAAEAERLALWRYQRALEKQARKEIRQRRNALEAAREKAEEAVARIRREQKTAAELVYPQAAPLETIQKRLPRGDVLLLYGLLPGSVVAFVVTREDARIVPLGDRQVVERTVRSLNLEDPESDSTAPLATLRRLVFEPLDLGDEVRRILVSPAGILAHVPFSLLVPDRTVAYVPSGTTYGVLWPERRARGKGILALGDPEYSTRSGLARLPGTRIEAETVGDVHLIGPAATETGFRNALRQRPRWSAVHFACHGLVDPRRPLQASLALTPSGDEDGFLTTLEVFRLRVPADLVVLSACSTATGKVYLAEGIVGLTRAFMMAGAPRVLASLWEVDDEATRALMVKFYELWKPGKVSTATALRKAQEHVASHEKWKHPAYWAAWQLWGLPD